MYKYFYLDTDSFFHRLDPRTKLLITLSHYIILGVFTRQLYLMLIVLALEIVLAYISRTIINLKRVLIVIVALSITSIVSWMLISKGHTPLIGPITLEPILQGVSAALRATIGIVISVILLSTTRNEELSKALVKIGVPYRGGFAFSSALRMAPTLIGVCLTVVAAQKSRGLDLESGSLLTRIKKYIPLLAPAVLLTIRSTERFAMAIESKGFGYQSQRGEYLILRMSKADYIFCAISILMAVAAIIIAIKGWFIVYTLN